MKKAPVFAALDISSEAEALRFARRVSGLIRGFKAGPRLFLRSGASLIPKLKALGGEVFLDFKFFDIPSSTEEAIRSAHAIGASYATAHAGAGEETLKRLGQFQQWADCRGERFLILCVTALSSHGAKDEAFLKTEPRLFRPERRSAGLPNEAPSPQSAAMETIKQRVLALAKRAASYGLRGFVSSPLEIKALRAALPKAFLVAPGIRPARAALHDQKRALSPKEALAAGADMLVMGRSLIEAKDPQALLSQIQQESAALQA